MLGKNTLDICMIIVALGAAAAINRSNVKKQTIQDLKDLVEAHEKTIAQLKQDKATDAERIRCLEETIDGYSELVREGHLAGSNRGTSGRSPTDPKTTKNRSS